LQENNGVQVQRPDEIESKNCTDQTEELFVLKDKRLSSPSVVECIDLTVDEVNEQMNTTDYFSEDSPRIVKSRLQPKECNSESRKATKVSECTKCNYSVAYSSLLHDPLCKANVSKFGKDMDITSSMNESYDIYNAQYVFESRIESIYTQDVREQSASIYKCCCCYFISDNRLSFRKHPNINSSKPLKCKRCERESKTERDFRTLKKTFLSPIVYLTRIES